ncbi:MAG: sulfate ABC transporter permease subunit CysT [Syntrophales bacterium]|jgi:sulfate transport system permease protein|nr:sulfate ABC transporter permease subunit CysT [Syntrophales bacterium]MCK9527035.1 sulfate ABC transporter permease subunit CysT [Syntrophales bacterium]MDX9921840.1 sulfate ABC transporter permease subunit CysT [Syntrophales bacterium]
MTPSSVIQRVRLKQTSVLPGFGLSMGFTLFYLALLVLIPLGGLVLFTGTRITLDEFWVKAIADPRVLASYRLSLGGSFIAALLNAVFGLIVAWVLVRYEFPGKRFMDAIVDLPFALPTAVSGIALTTLYVHTGWIGRWFEPLGIQIAYAWPGIIIALTLIGLPFVVRTVQPALEGLEPEIEEAAASLGATRWQTFVYVTLPTVMPSLLTGFALAFARAVGEFGSVYFIAGNMPYKTEIAPLLILIKLEQFDYVGATAIGVVMLIVAFVLLLIINLLQWWSRRHQL